MTPPSCGVSASGPWSRRGHRGAGGYRDLPGFGRRFIGVKPEALTQDVIYQIGALKAFAWVAGVPGPLRQAARALYNAILHHEEQAAAVVYYDPTLPVLGLPGSARGARRGLVPRP